MRKHKSFMSSFNRSRLFFLLPVIATLGISFVFLWQPTAKMQINEKQEPGQSQPALISNFGNSQMATLTGTDWRKPEVSRLQAETLTLGTYPNTSVGLGSNITITPSAAPTATTSISVSAPTNFIGKLTANTATGVVRVTNAALANTPPGAYPVTVRGFGPTGVSQTTFMLTVTSGTLCSGSVGFTNTPDVVVGNTVRAVTVGDFNNDGNQDIAAANQGSSTVSIRLGNGLGGFGGTTDVAVGGFPQSATIGDFNGDGNQDIAAANLFTASVSIRLGDGLGGFSPAPDASVGSFPQSVAVGDFNNDGRQDIATANSSSTISIRLGDGLGGFSGTTDVGVGQAVWVAVGDFNNDGNQDIVSANLGDSVSIRLGNGLGGFSGTTDLTVLSTPRSIAVGDFNSDGKQDIAIANQGLGAVSIRLGDGLGGFSGTTDVAVGTLTFAVAVGDFNNDGKQDIAAANQVSSTVSIRFGDGLGGFSGTTDVVFVGGIAPSSLAIGDFNNDGKQDFAAAGTSTSLVSIRLGACNAPTAANVSISGRVLTSEGRGLTNAIVYLTDSSGNTRSTRSSSFGYYRFEEVEAGQSVVIGVRSKQYQFEPRVITLSEDLANFDFYPTENSKY